MVPEKWLPLAEYSVKNGISISTLRRYIKANRIPYRKDAGKYWVQDAPILTGPRVEMGDADLHERLGRFERELKQAKEEIAELKMLVALYEDKLR